MDTGSTDGTVEIAERFGARIFHHSQSPSFTSDNWLFQIDADEELFAEDGAKLKEMVQRGEADYYHCQ